jgi:hypothetical protein
MRFPRRAGALLLVVAALSLPAACRRGSRDPLVTFYNPDYNLRVEHPASWKGDQAEQDGIWYRYFLGPPTANRKPAVSVTLFAGPLTTTVDDYSQRYLGGATVRSAKVEDRQGLPARRWDYTAADGTRAALLLVEQRQPGRAWIYGLYAQGESGPFEDHVGSVEEMFKSLAVDRPASWKEYKGVGYVLRVPDSWREARHFSGGGKSMLQWSSPAVGAERAQTLHASLTLSVEPTTRTLEAYHKEQRDAQGESFALLGHGPWKDGFVDSLRTETPMATSRVKRYYRVLNGKAYVLALDAREDVFPRVARWADQIASTLVLDGEPAPAASPAAAAPSPAPLVAR